MSFVLPLLGLGIPVILVIWLVVTVVRTSRQSALLASRLDDLETQMGRLKRREGGVVPSPSVPESPVTAVPPRLPSGTGEVCPSSLAPKRDEASAAPPPLPPKIEVRPAVTPFFEEEKRKTVPSRIEAINWERFMGVKLFAWIGGFALFLAMAYFVKLSIENNWVRPEIRIALGFVTGAGLLAAGMELARRRYDVTGQTLCATGVVCLYAVTFAARTFYGLIGPTPAFLLMTLITAAAFLIAVRMDAQVVAILGLLGGFLTPVLLSTGQDHPLGLFGYIALLDAGLLAVALRRPWKHLVPLAAAGTVLMQIGWAAKFFVVDKVFVAMAIFLGFEALFLLGLFLAQRLRQEARWISLTAAAMPFVVLGFAGWLLVFDSLAARPWVVFSLVLAADLGALAVARMERPLRQVQALAGGVVFVLLGAWTVAWLKDPLLYWALGLYFLFALLHAVFPVVMSRLDDEPAPSPWSHLFPLFALMLVLIHIAQSAQVLPGVWVGVLLLDLLAIGMALVVASVAAMGGALVLTLIAAGLWLVKPAALMPSPNGFLVVVGGFALVFFAAGIFAARRLAGRVGRELEGGGWGDAATQIPALSAILPFLLLTMAAVQLPRMDPSPVFGLALLLAALLLGVGRLSGMDWLPAVGLVCVLALEYVWHFAHLQATGMFPMLGWNLAFIALFAVEPFTSPRLKARTEAVIPWAVAAAAGPLHFHLVHQAVVRAHPNDFMGLLPAVFAVPSLLGLVHRLRALPVGNPSRNAQLAWFGGAALFFITLIFPIQFSRQWITIGWALEGAALLWLFHRVPHPGLRLVGAVLLAAAFARLALNPAVLDYHPRSPMPIWNWYLYSYGLVTFCLLGGGRLLAPPREWIRQVNASAALYALGVVLAFLLLNIEIADFFSKEGSTLTFKFSGNFARDMSYSIAWALFGLLLLMAGIGWKNRAARHASLGLLSVTLLKLFFHDLKNLNQLYRVGALVGVAVVLILASFAYQKFLPSDDTSKKPTS